MIEDLVARVFATRNAVHLQHWASYSYAEHQALGAFYKDIIEEIDSIVEMYQGAFGKIKKVPLARPVSIDDIKEHIASEAKWIEGNREEICRGIRALENAVDGLSGLYMQTYFLLRDFK